MEQPGMATLRRVLQISRLRVYASSLQPISLLGQGGFGAVELCWHTHPVTGVRTKVATKRIKPEVLANPAMLQLLCQEIETLLSFQHRHAVKILGIGVDDGPDTLDVSDDAIWTKLFLVQEYLPGGSLRRLVSEMSLDWNAYGVTTRVMLSWLVQLASVLSTLHSSSPPIVHRDIKLDNIMLTDSPKPSWSRALSQSMAHGRDSALAMQDLSARTASVDSAVASRPGQRSTTSRLAGIEIRVIDFGLARTLPRTKEVMQNKPLATPARSAQEQQWNDVLTPVDSSALPLQHLPGRFSTKLSQLVSRPHSPRLSGPGKLQKELHRRPMLAAPGTGVVSSAETERMKTHEPRKALLLDLNWLDQHSVRRSPDIGAADCMLLDSIQSHGLQLQSDAAAFPLHTRDTAGSARGSSASCFQDITGAAAADGVPATPLSTSPDALGLSTRASPVGHTRRPLVISSGALTHAHLAQRTSNHGGPRLHMVPASPAAIGVMSMGSAAPLRLSDVLHDLTGSTGSLMTMAPEVFKGQPYNHKADTFSFAVVAYELLHRRLILVSILERHLGSSQRRKEAAVVEYAAAVSAGYRPPLHANMPASLKQLIESCWDANPLKRPPMAQVEAELRGILETEDVGVMDSQAQGASAPACCNVM